MALRSILAALLLGVLVQGLSAPSLEAQTIQGAAAVTSVLFEGDWERQSEWQDGKGMGVCVEYKAWSTNGIIEVEYVSKPSWAPKKIKVEKDMKVLLCENMLHIPEKSTTAP